MIGSGPLHAGEPENGSRVAHIRAAAAGAMGGEGRRFDELLPDLMRRHYDPLYDRSIGKSFVQWQQSPLLPLQDGAQATLRAAARALLAG